jgi:hypothetical protein
MVILSATSILKTQRNIGDIGCFVYLFLAEFDENLFRMSFDSQVGGFNGVCFTGSIQSRFWFGKRKTSNEREREREYNKNIYIDR